MCTCIKAKLMFSPQHHKGHAAIMHFTANDTNGQHACQQFPYSPLVQVAGGGGKRRLSMGTRPSLGGLGREGVGGGSQQQWPIPRSYPPFPAQLSPCVVLDVSQLNSGHKSKAAISNLFISGHRLTGVKLTRHTMCWEGFTSPKGPNNK